VRARPVQGAEEDRVRLRAAEGGHRRNQARRAAGAPRRRGRRLRN
jgi:hypothetical protein